MIIEINGKDTIVDNKITVQNLIDIKKLKIDKIVVELNGSIIRREEYVNVCLKVNDRMEIVSFVGGG